MFKLSINYNIYVNKSALQHIPLPPLLRTHPIFLLKNPIKIAQVTISNRQPHICNRQIGILQQELCLGESFLLYQFCIITSGQFFNMAAQPIDIIFQLISQLRQPAVFIPFFNKPVYSQDQLLIIVFLSHFHLVCIIHQLQEEKSHGNLIHASLILLIIHNRPNQVLHQILYGQHIRNPKMEITNIIFRIPETSYQKGSDQIFFSADHIKCLIKKFRQNNKVHSHIGLFGRINFLYRLLAQEKKLSCVQDYFISIYNMYGLTGTHIDNLHIIVGMSGKVDKAGMRTDLNQFPAIHKLSAIHAQNRYVQLGLIQYGRIHIAFLIDLTAAFQNFCFFLCYFL